MEMPPVQVTQTMIFVMMQGKERSLRRFDFLETWLFHQQFPKTRELRTI